MDQSSSAATSQTVDESVPSSQDDGQPTSAITSQNVGKSTHVTTPQYVDESISFTTLHDIDVDKPTSVSTSQTEETPSSTEECVVYIPCSSVDQSVLRSTTSGQLTMIDELTSNPILTETEQYSQQGASVPTMETASDSIYGSTTMNNEDESTSLKQAVTSTTTLASSTDKDVFTSVGNSKGLVDQGQTLQPSTAYEKSPRDETLERSTYGDEFIASTSLEQSTTGTLLSTVEFEQLTTVGTKEQATSITLTSEETPSEFTMHSLSTASPIKDSQTESLSDINTIIPEKTLSPLTTTRKPDSPPNPSPGKNSK